LKALRKAKGCESGKVLANGLEKAIGGVESMLWEMKRFPDLMIAVAEYLGVAGATG
jgi:hypothetical protein